MNNLMVELGTKRSIIRELFEYSKKMKQLYGEDKVYDFSIGNPSVATPSEIDGQIIDLVKNDNQVHGYTSSVGNVDVRDAIAKDLNSRYHTSYTKDNLYMTCGASSAISIALKAVVSKDSDVVLAIAPYFPEYKVYAMGAGASFRVVPADMDNFGLNIKELEKYINENTIVVIINSPNNPSGNVYSKEEIEEVASFLLKKEKEYGHDIYILCDEPYREIVYDGINLAHIPSVYHNTILCYSYSKSLSLPGERIGYILVGPNCNNASEVLAACLGAGRMMGYVCASSLFQKVIAKNASALSDLKVYDENRKLLYDGLTKIGYKCIYPKGAFYLFVKALEDDAYKFMERAKNYNLVLVPSDNFGVKGYMRLAYCVSSQTIINSIPAFEKLYKEYN